MKNKCKKSKKETPTKQCTSASAFGKGWPFLKYTKNNAKTLANKLVFWAVHDDPQDLKDFCKKNFITLRKIKRLAQHCEELADALEYAKLVIGASVQKQFREDPFRNKEFAKTFLNYYDEDLKEHQLEMASAKAQVEANTKPTTIIVQEGMFERTHSTDEPV